MVNNYISTSKVAFTMTKCYNVSVKRTKYMKENDIIEIANLNNGYIYKELMKKYDIDYTYVSRLAKKGFLKKIYSGIYVTSNCVEDIFFINSIRFSRIVYSGDTAIFLNGLSNKQFPEYEAMVPYGTNIPKIDNFSIKQSRKQLFYLGITEIETPFGNKVKCYDKERCICDLFIRPEHYDFEDRIYAINEYKTYYLDFDKLYDYAKQLGIIDIIKSVFEVVGWN